MWLSRVSLQEFGMLVSCMQATYVDVMSNHLLDDLFSFGKLFHPSYVDTCNLDFSFIRYFRRYNPFF